MIEDMAGEDSLERNQFEVLRGCEFHVNDEIAGSSHAARFFDERLHRERKPHVLGHDEGEQKTSRAPQSSEAMQNVSGLDTVTSSVHVQTAFGNSIGTRREFRK